MARLAGQVQRQGRLSLMKMGKFPASCTRHNPGGKRLSAAIDDDAGSWEVHAVACKRMRLGPGLLPGTCEFCVKSFRSAQGLGGHMHVHREERNALKTRLKADATTATAREIQLCNETTAAAATSTQKIQTIHVRSPVLARVDVPVDVAAVEMLGPPPLSNQDSDMATLLSLLGLAPQESGTTTKFIPTPPPLLQLPLQELVTTSARIQPPLVNLRLIPPQLSSLPLSQSKSTPVVLKHPHSFSTRGKFHPPQSLELPLWLERSNFPLPQQQRRSSLVMPSPPVSITSSSHSTFHPYESGLMKLGRFSVMASAPLDLEPRLGLILRQLIPGFE